jgi:hypothetical protein
VVVPPLVFENKVPPGGLGARFLGANADDEAKCAVECHRRLGEMAPGTNPPNVSVNWVQFATMVALPTGPFAATPRKAATAVPTPSMGLEPRSTSST